MQELDVLSSSQFTNLPILRVWNMTFEVGVMSWSCVKLRLLTVAQLNGDYHVSSPMDCLHQCQPGVTWQWMRIFNAMMLGLAEKL